jgi:hypothetical protein
LAASKRECSGAAVGVSVIGPEIAEETLSVHRTQGAIMSAATSSNSPVITDMDLREHFRSTVSDAIANQRVELEEETVFYLVNMLAYFARADRLFDESSGGVVMQPLAMIYARAVQARSVEDRHRAYKHLGDVALLVAGMFAESLNRKLVDLDYYVAMGSSAYACLSDEARQSVRAHAFQTIFAELSRKFQRLVDVLAEVSEQSRLGASSDMLRLYELWMRTGSPRAAGKLRALGLEPIQSSFAGFRG